MDSTLQVILISENLSDQSNIFSSSPPIYPFRGHVEGTQWVKAGPTLDESPLHSLQIDQAERIRQVSPHIRLATTFNYDSPKSITVASLSRYFDVTKAFSQDRSIHIGLLLVIYFRIPHVSGRGQVALSTGPNTILTISETCCYWKTVKWKPLPLCCLLLPL